MNPQEIFKARRLDNGEWISNDLTKIKDGRFFFDKKESRLIEIDPATLTQISGKVVEERDMLKLQVSTGLGLIDKLRQALESSTKERDAAVGRVKELEEVLEIIEKDPRIPDTISALIFQALKSDEKLKEAQGE